MGCIRTYQPISYADIINIIRRHRYMQTSEMSHLIFNFYDDKGGSVRQRYGTLVLKTPVARLRFQATSGLAGYQSQLDCWRKGKGAIPPHSFVGIENYSVHLRPINLNNVKGVSGNFYPITPFKNLVRVNGMSAYRIDLGIHFDANVVGTSGCVGVNLPDQWKMLEHKFSDLLEMGFQTIPLFVPTVEEGKKV